MRWSRVDNMMQHKPQHSPQTAGNRIHRVSPRQTPISDDVRGRVASLLSERDQLREEIKQLSATVQIYSEIVRRLEAGASRRAA